jgi:predicted secreted protein
VGAWGVSSFENDDAADWIVGFTPSRARQRIIAAFRRVMRSEAVESPVGTVGLAACELVAAASGHPHESQPESLAQIVFALSRGDLDELRSTAVSALVRIAGEESELAVLWQESGDADWRQYMAELSSRLQADPLAVDRPPRAKRRRRSKLGDMYEVFDPDLGYSYFQFVAKTSSGGGGDVVLVLKDWYATAIEIEHLIGLFSRWTEAGYLHRTFLPPDDDEGSALLGTFEVPSQALSTIWMRVTTGWITRDYVDPEPSRDYRDEEFFQLHPEIDEEMLAPWPISFSVVSNMKRRGKVTADSRSRRSGPI